MLLRSTYCSTSLHGPNGRVGNCSSVDSWSSLGACWVPASREVFLRFAGLSDSPLVATESCSRTGSVKGEGGASAAFRCFSSFSCLFSSFSRLRCAIAAADSSSSAHRDPALVDIVEVRILGRCTLRKVFRKAMTTYQSFQSVHNWICKSSNF